MVELTIEQKAKAYDKALERAKSVDDPEWLSPREVAEYIFPELKDSDNKRVEIKLIEFFKGYFPDKEWWGNITQRDILTWLEKHGEQKYADNVKPKFKVGDIVRNIDSGELFHIEKVDSRNYWDGHDSFYIIDQEQWELVEQKSSWSKEDEMQLDAAIHLVSSTGHIETANWLKDLKNRVQSQQKWSEEDEYLLDETIKHLEALIRITKKQGSAYSDEIQYYQRDIDWLKSLREKIQSQPKHEWSEEDERIYRSIIYSFAHNFPLTVQQQVFVKSFKERYAWKPSDEQFKLLKHIMENVPLSYRDKSEVGELYLDLKRLGGE